jgi:hypothetical protein
VKFLRLVNFRPAPKWLQQVMFAKFGKHFMAPMSGQAVVSASGDRSAVQHLSAGTAKRADGHLGSEVLIRLLCVRWRIGGAAAINGSSISRIARYGGRVIASN